MNDNKEGEKPGRRSFGDVVSLFQPIVPTTPEPIRPPSLPSPPSLPPIPSSTAPPPMPVETPVGSAPPPAPRLPPRVVPPLPAPRKRRPWSSVLLGVMAVAAAAFYGLVDTAQLRRFVAPYINRPVDEVPGPAPGLSPLAPPAAAPDVSPAGSSREPVPAAAPTPAPELAPPAAAPATPLPEPASVPPEPAPSAPALSLPNAPAARPPAPVAVAPVAVPPAPEPAAAHVTIRFRRATEGAEAQANRIAALLRAAGTRVELRPGSTNLRVPTILYFRPDDAGAANALWASLSGETTWITTAGSGRRPPGNLEVWLP